MIRKEKDIVDSRLVPNTGCCLKKREKNQKGKDSPL